METDETFLRNRIQEEGKVTIEKYTHEGYYSLTIHIGLAGFRGSSNKYTVRDLILCDLHKMIEEATANLIEEIKGSYKLAAYLLTGDKKEG